MKKAICFDFDGVIHKYSKGWCNGEIYDEPVEGVRDFINNLKKDYYIIISSARINDGYLEPHEVVNQMYNWLKKHDIYFDKITGKKPIAEAYIDDRAIKFDGDWNYVYNEINNMKDQ